MRAQSAVAITLAAATLMLGAWHAPAPLDYPIAAVPSRQVVVTDAFWAARMEANRSVSIQAVFDRSQARGGGSPAQLIEAAAHMLTTRRDPDLERRVDEAIARQASAINGRLASSDDTIRTQGTFLEAAVAYYQATGK